MKWVVYNLLFALVFPFLLPGFLVRMLRRGGYRARMGDRFALYPPDVVRKLSRGGHVWIHAVSVGEVQVAGQLMREWRKADPSVRFCFSTTSSTGWKSASAETGPDDVLIYNPLDFPTFVTAALRTVSPRAIILTESEIWPVFIRSAAKRSIPLFLVNARVSDRSAPRYAKARFFFKDVFSAFTRIFAQSGLDRDRLLAAGAPAGIVEVSGSFKFDVARRNKAKEDELRSWIGPAAEGRKILLGGSTWPGEDKVLLSILSRIPAGRVLLVIAPRHFEKADAVEANIRAAGHGCVRRSRGDAGAGAAKDAVFLADTTGELMGLYGIADFVFVGKSLCEHGSQNMIEPCLCGKPTAVGPFTENFRPVMSDLLESRALVQVSGAEELERTVLGWLSDGDGGLGDRAKAAVERRRGVVPACVAAIRRAIPCIAAALVAAGAHAAAEVPKFGAIRTVGAYLALAERPNAARVYLADDEAEKYAGDFEVVRRVCATRETAKDGVRYDIVLAGAPPAGGDWSSLVGRLAERGVLVCAVDVRKMSAGGFRDMLESFPCPEARLWMPGVGDWVVTGKMKPAKLKMDALLGLWTQNDGFVSSRADEAGCGSVQELFANYVGSRKDVMPALEGTNLSFNVTARHLLPVEMPDLDWIDPAGVDADIVLSLADSIRMTQEVRRRIVAGDVLASCGKTDEAVKAWGEAYVSNPRDTMLLDRLYTLIVNARAFSNFGKTGAAAQCYDIYFAIRPDDLHVAEEYAKSLEILGRAADARKIREYVSAKRVASMKGEAERISRAKEDIRKWKEDRREVAR
ncbi:MAG: 3-deoxy-D-manno-octulosonic acid transferase [Kiritimatiellae bacterium]|nr:3-deoxy-D-manno-octulosonic acid transferase [Kiritimatiellia bacterium]